MRKHWLSLIALGALSLSPLGLQAPLAQTAVTAAEHARVIVKFKADSPLLRRQAQAATRSSEQAKSLGERVGLALSGGAMVSERSHVVTASGISSEELAKRLSAQGDVEYAEPAHFRRRLTAPNDPRYTTVSGGNGPTVGQWYLRANDSTVKASIDVEPAWAITTGSSSVVVADLDTGIRYDHADLKTVAAGGNLLPGYDMVTDLSISNDGDGRDADASDPGDFVTAAEAATSQFKGCDQLSSWHGTQTAGLIGALTDNAVGMASVGRTVRVLPVRVLGKCGGFDDDIQAGMLWAAGISVPGVPDNPPANWAKVINMSLGGDGACTQSYQDVIAQLTARGVVVVASAGNSAGHAVSSPANCPGVIAVTGVRHIGSKVGFADVGTEVAIAAPGGNCVNTGSNQPCLYPILTSTNGGSTTPLANSSVYTDSYNASIGTSFSAPLVAGTVALMLTTQPSMSVASVRAALQGSARTFPNTGGDSSVLQCHAPNGVDQDECYCTATTCGAGMLDAGAAVTAANRGLQARITLNNETPPPLQLVTLTAANSFVLSSRSLQTYQWTLVSGGGIVTALAANGATATATPSGVGRFVVSLTVTDSTGAQSTTTRAVDVLVPVAVPPARVPQRQDSGGGGALGIVWLGLLLSAVVALQLQRRRAVRTTGW